MTLNLHEDGLILCDYGAGLSHGSLSVTPQNPGVR